MENKNCPICNQNMTSLSRYPNQICSQCYELTVTQENEKIEFYNEGPEGGFISIVNNVRGNTHECNVNNIQCYADEGRFGGIVISVVR